MQEEEVSQPLILFICNKNNTCRGKWNVWGLSITRFIFSIYLSATLVFLAWLQHPWWFTRKRRGDRPRVLTVLRLYFQIIVQSGRHPTVLQKLCQLPFQYFSDPRLIKVLFPSLIAACYNNPQNKIILEQEMSSVLLATFIQVVIAVTASLQGNCNSFSCLCCVYGSHLTYLRQVNSIEVP